MSAPCRRLAAIDERNRHALCCSFIFDVTLFTLELFAPLQDCLFYTIARSEADQAVTFLTGTLAGALRPRNGHFPHLMATAQKRQLAQKV